MLEYWYCATSLSSCSVKVITMGCCTGTMISLIPWVTHFNTVLAGLVKVLVLLRSVYITCTHVRNLPALKASGFGAAVSMCDCHCTWGAAYSRMGMGSASLLMQCSPSAKTACYCLTSLLSWQGLSWKKDEASMRLIGA